MSLVVSKRIGDSITIVGDTHLTYEYVQQKVPPLEGAIKSYVLDPGFSVNFAGSPDDASQALRKFRYAWRTEASINSVVQHFLTSHRQSEQKVDYILAFRSPVTALIEVKHGTAREVNSTWIGHPDAFKVFQHAFHEGLQPATPPPDSYAYSFVSQPNHRDTQKGIVDKMMNALQVVIEQKSVPSVSGFVVPIASYREDLRYVEYLRSVSGPVDLESIGDTAPLPTGGAAEGHYTICFFFAHNGRSCHPMIYFYQGEFGVLFTPNSCGVSQIVHRIPEADISRTFVYRSPSIGSFIQQVRMETGLFINTHFANEHWLNVAVRGMFGKLSHPSH